MKLSSSIMKKLLIFPQKKVFLIFHATYIPRKKSLIFPETELSESEK